MTYDEWEAVVPSYFRNDPLWSVTAYRKSLFMADIAWPDVTKLVADRRTISLADQLYRYLYRDKIIFVDEQTTSKKQ